MQLQLSRPLAFFDLETTGLTIGFDRIIEVSVLKLMPEGSKYILTQRINPEMPIPEVVTNLTGITNQDVEKSPVFSQFAGELREFIGNSDLAGYNSNKFDVPVLVDEFLRVGIDFDITDRKLVDIQNIFHKMEQRTLSAAYKFYCQKDLVNAHSAEADIQATFDILEAQLDRYPDLEKNVDFLHKFTNMYNAVDLAGRIVLNDKSEAVFNFGKHKGRMVTDVFSGEPSYYDWLMKGDFPRQTKQVFEKFWLSLQDGKLQKLKEKFGSK